ncbi:ABC transporter ATP-binding protein [Burkholderiaceae bacterium FT117]|uniref:ABC transporter ATP-binding protein n=1 Tax=Zeimonas sediminis TaxID=2944268 RepID=UPI00234308F4|nr:ABC transporter ATP-binding protein [Zeimonas sediminis]MCM5571809.1 ABC transporter ATP-binding protein [Zeimonas sediminis]
MSAAIEISSVVKRYGSFEALRGVSLSIGQGEFFGLLGPNGAGKTTLISIVAGLSRPDSGEVRIMGHDVSGDFRAARRALGVVPQELVFDPFFTVRETLRITSGYYGIRRNDDWIDEILAHLDLSAKADSNMRALSGGMKRRVLVAQALVHRPPVIVLDEPTAGVDVELRQTLWQFIRRLNREGHTIVLTTHYLEEAQELCGRIAMLKQGQVVALDETSALLRRFAGGRLRLALSGAPLPVALEPLRLDESAEGAAPAAAQAAPGAAQRAALRVDDYAAIEGILAALREGGCRIDEMELQHADLEDVFVQIMKDNR